MKYTYRVLKSSWGISVELDMEEIKALSILDSDLQVFDNVYLRVGDQLRIKKSIVEYWSIKALNDLRNEIDIVKNGKNICYYIKGVEFSFIDFQEEGIYCAILGWFAEFYDINIALPEVEYDKYNKRYIFTLAGAVLK